MTNSKIIFITILIAYIICNCFYPKYAEAQLTNAAQFVNLYGSSTDGQITSFSIILPSGQSQAYQIPSGKALMIQQIDAYFLPNTPASITVALVMNPYVKLFGLSSQYWNNVRFSFSCPFAISDNSKLVLKTIDNTTGNLFTGKLEVHIFGYILPLTAGATNSTNLLLLGKLQSFNAIPQRTFAELR